MKTKRLFLQYKFSFLCVFAIMLLSLYPMQETPLKDVSISDKWAHLLMYGGLSTVVFIEMLRNGQVKLRHTAFYVLVCPILLGILLEFAQAYLTTYRSGETLDALANSLGALIVFIFCQVFCFIKKR